MTTNNAKTTEELIDLQMTIAHLQVTVDTLNDVIAKQDKQLQDMQRQLQLMYKHLNKSDDDGIAPFDLIADKPPHY